MEDAIVGSTPVVFTDANITLIASQSTTDQQYRYLYLNCSGTLSAQRTLFVPAINKNYIVINNTTGGYGIQVQTVAGTGIVVPNATTVPLYVDGTNVTAAYNYVPTLTLGSALPMSSGGTNNTSTPTANSIVYTSTTTVGATTFPLMTYVPGNTSTTPFFLSSTGTGSAANAPTLTGSTGSGSVVLANQPTFSATQGNAPFSVNSTTVVANLNAATAAKLNNSLVQGSGIVFSTGTTYDGSQQITISATTVVGVTSIAGTTNQINASSSTGAVTLSMSSNYLPNQSRAALNSQTSAYIVAASDSGKIISITTGGVTVNNSIMSAGDIVTIYNNSGSSQTITQGTGVTLQWAGQGSSTTGNRTLTLYSVCTIFFLTASSAVISGGGLT
jgi:hypothetical protein